VSFPVGSTCLPGKYIFKSFSCGDDFASGALYLFFITLLWARLLFWDLLISSEASLICSVVSSDFLASSSLRKVVPEVNTSRCYKKHQQSYMLPSLLQCLGRPSRLPTSWSSVITQIYTSTSSTCLSVRTGAFPVSGGCP
jgi:hypothetical protein